MAIKKRIIKPILTSILKLMGIGLQAQEIGRLNSWTEYNADSSVYRYYDCNYNENNKLSFISEGNNDEAVLTTYKYSNDTMYERINHVYSNKTEYEYTPDTVFLVEDGDTIIKYNINPEYQIIEGEYYRWVDGNCITAGDDWTAIFQEYRNPWLFAQLYLKGPWWLWGLSNGSYNLLDRATLTNGTEFTMEVIESLGEWPVTILLKKNGELEKFFIVEYYDWITNTQEMPIEPNRVLSTDYYNIMGRKIDKPKRGFYIELNTTDKGVICKKYFMQ